MILSVLSLVAALTAEPAPKAEIARARFDQPKVVLSRIPSTGSSASVAGGLVVSFSGFAGQNVRCPVLHLTCVCEVNGVLECYHGFWDTPGTYRKMNPATVIEAFKAAGRELKGDERKTVLADPAAFTTVMPAVTRERYAKPCTYGDAMDRRNGFFRLRQLSGPARLLLVRLEIWQNGVRISEHESALPGLSRAEIPKDWHVWKKYPQKFKYVETH